MGITDEIFRTQERRSLATLGNVVITRDRPVHIGLACAADELNPGYVRGRNSARFLVLDTDENNFTLYY